MVHAQISVAMEQPGFGKVSGATKKLLEALQNAEEKRVYL